MWCAPGRNAQTLQAFFDLPGERRGSIRAVSIDMSGGYEKAIRENVPDAEIAFDPFHVVRLAQRAVDQVRRDECNAHERSHTRTGKRIKGTRCSLLQAPADDRPARVAARSPASQQAALPRVPAQRRAPRPLPTRQPHARAEHLDAWLTWASRSRLDPFIKLARTIRRHRDGILNPIRLGLNNGRLKGLTAASA